MGVPKFYRWISERYPCLSEVVREYQIPEFDNLYLDMNGIIHNCSHPNDDDVHFRISEEQIFQDIFRYIEFLFRMIKPRKVFFMAIDGVAPRAKMNQQRGRRFRSAQEASQKEKEAIARGETLPKEARFDSNCITPGTEFMDRLHQQLKFFVVNKMSSDELWKPVRVYLSGHETPGEGEHKIMDFIRHQKSQPNYNPNTRHCLYGLDADLIMLGLCSHEPHFSLLREEVKFISTKKVNKVTTRSVNPDVITFHLLHLSLLRDYLDHEFSALKNRLPFPYNLESIIDDWLLMGFLVGNDFIPHIPHFHINKNSLTNLYKCYIEVMPTLGGYINEHGTLNLERFEKFLKKVSEIDVENFTEVYADLAYFGAKVGPSAKGPNNGDMRKLEDFFSGIDLKEMEQDALLEPLEPMPAKGKNASGGDGPFSSDLENGDASSDSSELSDTFEEEFRLHKKEYYESKMEYKNADSKVLKEQALCYVRAIQWNLHYYYNGCVSWSWFYPHHYAPYISDVKNFAKDVDLNYDHGKPFRPFEQLLAVLPAASKELLPKAYRRLVTDERSPLIEFYPEDFELDMNGKQQAWEAVVKIPFIDEKSLVSAAGEINMLLSANEKRRNSHGPHLLFTYTEERQPPYASTLPRVFGDVAVNHAKIEQLDPEVFRIPQEQVVHGLCEGVRLDVQFPGFPTLKFIDHTAMLKRDKIRVFEMASNGDNMTLCIGEGNRASEDAESFARKYLNQSVFVNWPHLVEAKVIKVSDGESSYWINAQNEFQKVKLEARMVGELSNNIQDVERSYKERRGIYIGDTHVAIYALPITGRKYVPGASGLLTLEKQWSSRPQCCPLQTIVRDLSAYDPGFQQFKTVADIYPVGARCFVLRHPFYGCAAEVLENNLPDGTIKVKVFSTEEPDLSEIASRQEEFLNDLYQPTQTVANRLGIGSHLLTRLTGTIFLRSGTKSKLNIGLSIRHQSRGEEVPGFSRKVDKYWLLSTRIDDIISEYREKFPEVFKALATAHDMDSYDPEAIFGKSKCQERLSALQAWLRGLPTFQAPTQKFGAEILDQCIVKHIEMTTSTHLGLYFEEKTINLSLKPQLLYRPLHYLGFNLPDKKATYDLYDRVVSVREGTSVPLGAKGIVIGKHEDSEREVNTVYDVVFDEPFPGGTILRCSPGRGYKMSPASLINISFGQRISKEKNPLFKAQNGMCLQTARTPAKGIAIEQANSRQNRGKQQTANGQTPVKIQANVRNAQKAEQKVQNGKTPNGKMPNGKAANGTKALNGKIKVLPRPQQLPDSVEQLLSKLNKTPTINKTTQPAAAVPAAAAAASSSKNADKRSKLPPVSTEPTRPVTLSDIDKLFFKQPETITPLAQKPTQAAVQPQPPLNAIEQLFANATKTAARQ